MTRKPETSLASLNYAALFSDAMHAAARAHYQQAKYRQHPKAPATRRSTWIMALCCISAAAILVTVALP